MNLDTYYKRVLFDIILPFLGRKEIIGIRGPRQTGKTVLLKKIQEEFTTNGHNTHFLNLDNYNTLRIFMEDPLSIILKEKEPSKKLFLFVDEIQKAKNAGDSLKLIYDEYPDVKIFFSGSSSLEIKENVLPPLVGRVTLFELHSFDFQEFITAQDKGLTRVLRDRVEKITNLIKAVESNKNIKKYVNQLKGPTFVDEFNILFKKYLIWGGYPETIKDLIKENHLKKQENNLKQIILQNTINIYLEKDIKVHFNIEHMNSYISLTKIIGSSVGSAVVKSELASTLRISELTVQSYLNILEHSYIIKLIRPYHENIKSELRKQPKCYFMDNGMRNALLENFSPFDVRGSSERGFLLENFVFRQLLTNFVSNYKGWKLHYWRTKGGAEVDFILKKGKILIPIEVKVGGKKIKRGFYSFIETYKPKLAFIATLDTFRIEEKMGIPIIWIPAYYF